MASHESSDCPSLLQRYTEACEKHGVSLNLDIQMAISKAHALRPGSALKLNLEQLMKADMMPLADLFSYVNYVEGIVVDVVHNKEVLDGHALLRALRLAGPKLRLLDFKKIVLRRDTMRDLLHRGLQCHFLDLSFSKCRKLDMSGHFPQLHTLILDFSMYLTDLPEGCFRATPNLARLSICETKVANLWTTCAALAKLQSLVELRFQSCKCCEGTGCCKALQCSNSKYCLYLEENPHSKDFLGTAWMDTSPVHLHDFTSLNSEGSNFSNSDDGGDDNNNILFLDNDPAMMHHPIPTSSEGSSAESEVELDGHLLETMSVDDALNNQQEDVEYGYDILGVGSEQAEAGASNDLEQDLGPTFIERYVSYPGERLDSYEFPDTQSSSPDTSTSASLLESSVQKISMLLRQGGFCHPSVICSEKYYRDFMIARLPGLKVLDNLPITHADREKSNRIFMDHFEPLPINHNQRESILEVLKSREISSSIAVGASSRRTIGMGSKHASHTRSMCRLKMSACAWPSCVPLCKKKTSNLQLSRKYRPRQFEYHPSDPSLLVFGTLHGEVVVVNHESDKVVGNVQSNGPSHSILGLCWLNKDPNKLIAGADNGSLQLYDVECMRAIYDNNKSNNVYNPSGIRALEVNPMRAQRNSAICSFDNFEQLTSVHVNCSDEYFLASGYSCNVGLYDLCTGKQLHMFNNLHQQHINVVKFAHHSPHLFATSSFDKEIKMWDLRQRVRVPLYTVKSAAGNVMVCFSRDDYYLLSSAVDNEVRQHLAVDGRLHLKFDIPSSGSSQNYTRSYYMNGRDYIISGSCEENIVRLYCAQTGRRLRDFTLEGRTSKTSIYVQSLRGDPFRDFHFSVLAAYFHPHPKSEILKVNLLASSVHKKVSGADSPNRLPAGKGA